MKKICSVLSLTLLLALPLCVSAMAATEYGVIYDETDALGSPALTYLGEEVLPQLSEELGVDLRVDVVTTLSDYASLEEAAEGLYTDYNYGYGDEEKAVTLTVLMETSDGRAYAMPDGGWYVFACLNEDGEISQRLADAVHDAVKPYMAERAWNGEDMTMSATALSQAVSAMADAASSYDFGASGAGAESAETPGSTAMRYVYDIGDLLSYEEWAELEQRAEDISLRHSCGVYAALVDDYTEYGDGGDVYETTYQLYHASELGMGEDRNGIIILLSMAERDYAMFVYGDSAEHAFNEYGQEQLEAEFLGDFGRNDWYGGISHYLDACDAYLTQAEDGEPVAGGTANVESETSGPLWGIGLMTVLSCMIAGAICVRLKRKMRTVHQKAEANAYVAAGGLRLTEQYDRYTHTTKTRTKIAKESSSGGKGGSTVSRSGGGGSGRSGKF